MAESHGLGCGATGYETFRPEDRAAADAHVDALATIAARADEAVADPTKAEEAFGAIEAIYQKESQGLRATVRTIGAADVGADEATVGELIDLTVGGALAKGRNASDPSEARVAKEVITSALLRFYFLAANERLSLGTRAGYDAAAAYLGAAREAAPPRVVSIAAVAARVDAREGTTLGAEVLVHLLHGECLLDRALLAGGTDALVVADEVDVAAQIEATSDAATRALALAIGQDVRALVALDDADEASAQVQEPAALFLAIEPAMRAKDEAAAATIEAMFAKALNAVELGGDPARAIDADAVIEALEAAFGVRPKG